MTDHSLCSDVFGILAERARRRSTIAYSELGTLVATHHRSPRLHSALGSIWQWCQEQRHPHLNAIVVYKSGPRKGLPGSGYAPSGQTLPRDEWRLARTAIFDYAWPLVAPPAEWPDEYCGESG